MEKRCTGPRCGGFALICLAIIAACVFANQAGTNELEVNIDGSDIVSGPESVSTGTRSIGIK